MRRINRDATLHKVFRPSQLGSTQEQGTPFDMEMVHFIPPSQRRLAMLAAQADDASVLIYGGDGTGKSAIAKWIHTNGPRSLRPLVTFNRDLALSDELAKAQGGTLVIHEVGSWSLTEQKALLHFLNTRSLPAEGNGITALYNTRIIATTSQSVEGRAQSGMFNADLLLKLNVFRLEMPALTKRQEEFEDIVMGILGEITRELHRDHIRKLSNEAWTALRTYDWPGNLRELRNVLRLAVIACRNDEIGTSELPDFGHDRLDFRATREEFEKTYILELLKTFDWEIDRTCENSRMDRETLLLKMNRYGIKPESPLHP